MTALVDDLLDLLRGHRLVENVRVLYYDETPAGKVELKLRCRLAGEYQFQVWLHYEPDFQDYAYQLYARRPLLRWDNAPHYPAIATAPHHFHDENGQVSGSPLSGRPLNDLKKVLRIVDDWVSEK